MPNTVTTTGIYRSSKLLHPHKIVQKKKNTENYNILIGFLRQTDQLISTGVITSRSFGSEVTILIPMTVLPHLTVQCPDV